MRKWHQIEGSPYPQGVSFANNGTALNFSIYSKHATRVLLLLYADDPFEPVETLEFNPRVNRTHHLWHIRISLSRLNGAKYYGYRIWGPNTPIDFHCFDPDKILLDPFAQNVYFPPQFSRDAAALPGKNDGKAPLGVLPSKNNEEPLQPNHVYHGYDLVIYEMHVRQFTANPNSQVPQSHRGTYQGIIDKIPYLKELGITAVELMPIHQWDPQEGSAWGYMTLNFFTPHRQYATNDSIDGHIREFKAMVHALHAADISVILDVVYNHTTEIDDEGPIYSYKGIDNSSYYMMLFNGYETIYANKAGTGNTLYSANMQSRRMILESLRFWVSEMGIDGFRFDLSSIFALDSDGRYNREFYSVIHQISHDPVLHDIYIIAEPWDGSFDDQGYLLGKDFPGNRWMQWNDKARTTFRNYVKSEDGVISDLMTRLYGSNDLFPGPEDDYKMSRKPSQSVNYISSHDGLTMYDLVSYNSPDHQAWNCGWEGEEEVPEEVLKLRKRQIKNFFALLMLSNGSPMFRAGDEFLQTQYGQHNPYNIDDQSVWLDWDRKEKHHDVFRFVKKMIQFRKDHPSIARGRFWQEDVQWFGPEGAVDDTFTSHTLAFHLNGENAEFQLSDSGIYAMFNAYWEPIDFKMCGHGEWQLFVDTYFEKTQKSATLIKEGDKYQLAPRSIAVWVRR